MRGGKLKGNERTNYDSGRGAMTLEALHTDLTEQIARSPSAFTIIE